MRKRKRKKDSLHPIVLSSTLIAVLVGHFYFLSKSGFKKFLLSVLKRQQTDFKIC